MVDVKWNSLPFKAIRFEVPSDSWIIWIKKEKKLQLNLWMWEIGCVLLGGRMGRILALAKFVDFGCGSLEFDSGVRFREKNHKFRLISVDYYLGAVVAAFYVPCIICVSNSSTNDNNNNKNGKAKSIGWVTFEHLFCLVCYSTFCSKLKLFADFFFCVVTIDSCRKQRRLTWNIRYHRNTLFLSIVNFKSIENENKPDLVAIQKVFLHLHEIPI